MLSISKSRLAIPVQFAFFGLNTLGLAVGVIYDASTPDLYANNAHHKIGWIAFWVMAVQLLMGILLAFPNVKSVGEGNEMESEAFLPISTDAIRHHNQENPMRSMHEYRWSRDSGHGTEPSSPLSEAGSPKMEAKDFDMPELDFPPTTPAIPERSAHSSPRPHFCGLDRLVPNKTPSMMNRRVMRVVNVLNEIILRTCLLLGFAAVATGAVTYGGIMVSFLV